MHSLVLKGRVSSNNLFSSVSVSSREVSFTVFIILLQRASGVRPE
jgi:hypothetical protein